MRFSIIIPVYNVERYLGECLESIACQDYDDYEAIIVDDGSTDGSSAVYERFAAETDIPVRIVKQENKGLLGARRAGIKVAQGDYFWHVDGDDALAPGALQLVSDEIDRTGVDLVIVGASGSPDFDKALPGMAPGSRRLYAGSDINTIRSAFLAGFIPSIWAKIASRACVDVQRDYSEYGKLQLGEDQLQSLYILDRAESCACLREPLYYYRPNDSSITAKYRAGQTAQYAAVKEAVCRQALEWDKKWPGHGFADVMLAGYLSNGFYDMRKNADASHYRQQFQEFRETDLYAKAIGHTASLRFEQMAFYSFLNKKSDRLAYWWLLLWRAATPLVRAVSK